jgi:hypothetical protein
MRLALLDMPQDDRPSRRSMPSELGDAPGNVIEDKPTQRRWPTGQARLGGDDTAFSVQWAHGAVLQRDCFDQLSQRPLGSLQRRFLAFDC